MGYDGPSLSEWLAEYRSRRKPTEVVLHRARLPVPVRTHPSRAPIASLRISRFDDPDNPCPTRGFYLFSLSETDEWVDDSWHEELDDAFDQAEYAFDVRRSAWEAVEGESR
jgi:hypothetical protein